MKILYLISYLILLVLIFFALPKNISLGQGDLRWIVYFLIFFIQTFLLYITLTEYNVDIKVKKLIVPLSVLIIGPLYGTYMSYIKNNDLKLHGIETKGIVYKKFQSSNTSEWLIRCNFRVKNNIYSTFSETDKYNMHKIGDTLTILFNPKFPEECKILELE